MKHQLKLMLAGLVLCIMTHGLMMFLDFYVLVHLNDWTMSMTQKMLVFHFTALDRSLIGWLPLLIAIACAWMRVKTLPEMIRRVFLSTLMVLVFIVLGIAIGLLMWNDPSSLLPEYVKYQPFNNYWTVFIGIGMLLPLIPPFRIRMNSTKHN